ncbi:hypothetical protein [Agitococcus lubricus]|uniref:Uncharacterized protein n=1 Tax=Agitococcus lubricus TaxID=1077255 RepID=A0A2T5ISC7_9GAMM|nr:hypothetical protein [Agitococcus lubricus]PTQ86751.1 hypothetical protein C8N29_1314 [Agitococcus lubricus]
MNVLQKVKLTKELLSLVASLKGGQLKALDKVKTTKRVLELVDLLGGKAQVENTPELQNEPKEDKNIFLRQIVNDEINVFTEQAKLSDLELIDAESVDPDLLSQAAVNAARQVLKGLGQVVLN